MKLPEALVPPIPDPTQGTYPLALWDPAESGATTTVSKRGTGRERPCRGIRAGMRTHRITTGSDDDAGSRQPPRRACVAIGGSSTGPPLSR